MPSSFLSSWSNLIDDPPMLLVPHQAQDKAPIMEIDWPYSPSCYCSTPSRYLENRFLKVVHRHKFFCTQWWSCQNTSTVLRYGMCYSSPWGVQSPNESARRSMKEITRHSLVFSTVPGEGELWWSVWVKRAVCCIQLYVPLLQISFWMSLTYRKAPEKTGCKSFVHQNKSFHPSSASR